MQPAVFSEVSKDLLSQAIRACQGLDVCDGTAIITSIATRAAGLLHGFEVNDVDVRQGAEALAELVEKREDVFSDEHRADVASAFTEAINFKLLMDDAMLPLELLDPDMPIDTEDGWEECGLWEESGLWSQDNSNCVHAQVTEEVLDQLLVTLRESCAEGGIAT
jgi:hypothetical protein